jgi:hypothetical protein
MKAKARSDREEFEFVPVRTHQEERFGIEKVYHVSGSSSGNLKFVTSFAAQQAVQQNREFGGKDAALAEEWRRGIEQMPELKGREAREHDQCLHNGRRKCEIKPARAVEEACAEEEADLVRISRFEVEQRRIRDKAFSGGAEVRGIEDGERPIPKAGRQKKGWRRADKRVSGSLISKRASQLASVSAGLSGGHPRRFEEGNA